MEPATGGALRTNIADMQVGDYIVCFASFTNAVYTDDTLAYLGRNDKIATYPEFPLTGQATEPSLKHFYFIKADKGLLISDRVIHHTVSWDSLNTNDLIQGKSITFQGGFPQGGLLRSLGGGNSYATADGKSSATRIDDSYGTWPVDNEWNKYVAGMFDGRDDCWHWSGIRTWTQDTPSPNVSAVNISGQRVWRGDTSINGFQYSVSSSSGTSIGFRPCFQYEEATS